MERLPPKLVTNSTRCTRVGWNWDPPLSSSSVWRDEAERPTSRLESERAPSRYRPVKPGMLTVELRFKLSARGSLFDLEVDRRGEKIGSESCQGCEDWAPQQLGKCFRDFEPPRRLPAQRRGHEASHRASVAGISQCRTTGSRTRPSTSPCIPVTHHTVGRSLSAAWKHVTVRRRAQRAVEGSCSSPPLRSASDSHMPSATLALRALCPAIGLPRQTRFFSIFFSIFSIFFQKEFQFAAV